MTAIIGAVIYLLTGPIIAGVICLLIWNRDRRALKRKRMIEENDHYQMKAMGIYWDERTH